MPVEDSRAGDLKEFCFTWLLRRVVQFRIQQNITVGLPVWKGYSEVFQILALHSSCDIAGAHSVSTRYHT